MFYINQHSAHAPSRSGLIAYASSLDCIGPLGRTVEDCALMLGAMAGVDAADSTSSSEPVVDYATRLAPASSLSRCEPIVYEYNADCWE